MRAQSSARRSALLVGFALVLTDGVARAQPTFPDPGRYRPTESERSEIRKGIESLKSLLAALPADLDADIRSDVAIGLKAALWVDRHEEYFTKNDVGMVLKSLALGRERAESAARREAPWAKVRRGVARGFESRVDGSVQPYAIYVSPGLDISKPARLDVVLHGRGATLHEARFISTHEGKPTPEGRYGLILHVFGRTNNAYRWAGETDVFEAIEAVKRNYSVDPLRIVLRGFSMGGAGAWHLGLHYPSLWSSAESGAGFNETRDYARLKNVSSQEEKTLHIYDAVDYAANAFNLPMVGYGGENDPQLRATNNILEAITKLGYPSRTDGLVTRVEGFDFHRLIGKGMGHAVDPASAKHLALFHDDRSTIGSNPKQTRIRFVTYTLKYNQVGPFKIERLGEHYRRASLESDRRGGLLDVVTENVEAISVERGGADQIRLDGTVLPLGSASAGRAFYRKAGKVWTALDKAAGDAIAEGTDGGKRHGLQGPIDDAFTQPFLCVTGAGDPWNPAVAEWSSGRLKEFAALWDRRLRGELRVKSDSEVGEDDIHNRNLILFGDPGSNRIIARVLKELPVDWSRDRVGIAGASRPAGTTAPILIAPNPLNPRRYVVVNGIHTFGEKEFAGTNALLYPRLGDFALIDVKSANVIETGFYTEAWKRSSR